MKSLSHFLFFALAATLSAAEDTADPPSPIDVESVAVDLVFSESLPLQNALQSVAAQFDSPPSLVFKPGTEEVVVPPMQVENVRFTDLLSALEELCAVRFKVLNATPKPGESALVLIASAGPRLSIGRTSRAPAPVDSAMIDARTEAGFGPAPIAPASTSEEASVRPATVRNPVAGAGDSADSDLSHGDTSAQPDRPGNSGQSVPMLSEISHPGQLFGTGGNSNPTMMWNASGQPPVTTQTYAIGNFTGDEEHGHSAAEVIEAIDLAWTTARNEALPDTGPDAPRVSLHEPSALLIVRAPSDLQSLAAETIRKLVEAHQQRIKVHDQAKRSATLADEFRRERDHLEQLHQITVERLKAAHATEVDTLRTEVAELKAQLRTLQTMIREGGN